MDIAEKGKLNQPEVQVKIWNAVFISVFVTNLLMSFAQQISSSLVAKYADHLGASPKTVGVVVSAFAVTAIIFKFISAPAIDSFNRKYILSGAMLILAIGYVGLSLSRDISFLIASRLLQGAGLAFTATCCLTMAADALPPEKMSKGIGYFSLAAAASIAISPNIALYLSDTIGYNRTFAVSAVGMTLAIFISLRIKTKFIKTKKFKISIKNMIAKEAIVPALITFCLNAAYSSIGSFLIIYAVKLGIGNNIGLFFTVYAVTLLFSRPLVGGLADKIGHIKVLMPAFIFFATSFFIISNATKLWMFLVAAMISAFGYGSCMPLVQSLCMKLVPKDRRGAGSCTSYIGIDLGALVGPYLAGTVITLFGYSNMWRVMITPVFFAAIILLVFRSKISSVSNKVIKEDRLQYVSDEVKFNRSLVGYQKMWVTEKIGDINKNTKEYLNESESKSSSLAIENEMLRKKIAEMQDDLRNIKDPFDEIRQALTERYILNTKKILDKDVNVEMSEEEKLNEILLLKKEDARLKGVLKSMSDEIGIKIKEYSPL